MRHLAQASDAQLRIGESILSIVVMDSLMCNCTSGLTLRAPRNDSFASHRRSNPVAADIDAGGFQRAVFLLRRAEDDDLGARLQFGFVAGDEDDDRCIR